MRACSSEFQKLLKTLYNLSPPESKVLTYLCDKEARIEEIKEDLGKSRSTVQKYISSLRKAGLISRRSVTTKSGKGRYYVYFIKDEGDLKEKIIGRLEEWKREKEREIKKL